MRADALAALRAAYVEYTSIPFARGLNAYADLEDADLDFFEEDMYLAAAVEDVLRTAVRPTAQIVLQESIDRRLANLAQATQDDEAKALLELFLTKRQRMKTVAKLWNRLVRCEC